MKTCDGNCAKCALSPEGREWRTPDGFIKEVVLPLKGNVAQWHIHKKDHSTILSHGSVVFEVEGEAPKVLKAPDVLFIKAGIAHRMTALEHGTRAFCVHHLNVGEERPALIALAGE
jgi:quercetin dioxygenase-like cupin family protein